MTCVNESDLLKPLKISAGFSVNSQEGYDRVTKAVDAQPSPFDKMNILQWLAAQIRDELAGCDRKTELMRNRIRRTRASDDEILKNEAAVAKRRIDAMIAAKADLMAKLKETVERFMLIRKSILKRVNDYADGIVKAMPEGCDLTRQCAYTHDVAQILAGLSDQDFVFKNPPAKRRGK